MTLESGGYAAPSAARELVAMSDHYRHGDIECIDAIRAALTPEEFRGFCKGNIIKYAWRERAKGGDQDLIKLQNYATWAVQQKTSSLQSEIESLDGQRLT